MAFYNDKSNITCPFCGEKIDTSDKYFSHDGLTEIECGNCEKSITVSSSCLPCYTVQCGGLEKAECEWEIYKYDGNEHYTVDKKQIYVRCKNCEETNFIPLEEVGK